MTTDRTYGWMIKSAVAVLVAEVVLCAPLSVEAASAGGGASVQVMAQPSTLGTLSNFKVSVRQSSPGAKAVDATPVVGPRNPQSLNGANGESIQPAVFSVSGIPDQTFSIVVPQPGIATNALGSVEFLDFAHNAGKTPTIGADGTKVFEIGARMKFTSGAKAATDQTQKKITIAVKPTPAQQAGIPRPNPFGVQGVEDGFMNVLVSYN